MEKVTKWKFPSEYIFHLKNIASRFFLHVQFGKNLNKESNKPHKYECEIPT